MKGLKRVLAFLLTGFLMASMLPAALAADDDVLTSIGHVKTNMVSLSATARSAVLQVSHDYAGSTLDLSGMLKITYDETKYKSVVAVPTSATAKVCEAGQSTDADKVPIKVTYSYITDSDSALKRTATYDIRVEKAPERASVFSGTVQKRIQSGKTLSLSFSDFAADYQKNDGSGIDHFVIRGFNLATGTLQDSGGDYDLATPAQIAYGDFGKLSFSAASAGTVSYYVDAYESGGTVPIGTVTLTITVYAMPIQSAYSGSTYVGIPLTFTEAAFTGHCDLQGASVEALEINPASTACGTWSLGGSALTEGSANEIPAGQIGNLTFLGDAAGTAAFRWRLLTTSGYSDYGTGTVTVSALSLSLSSYSASTYLTRGSTWAVSPVHFVHSPSSVSLTFVKITSVPASADGYLCLTTALSKNSDAGYPAIPANTALSAGAILPYASLSNLRLVTRSSGSGDSASFDWTATVCSGAASATWAPDASYTVPFASAGTVRYSADMNVPLTLQASDFSSEFYRRSGYILSYMTFTLPAKTSGTLFYNYQLSSKTGTAVGASTKYYTSASPNLSDLTFVPAAGFVGSVSIPYQAYRSSGDALKGTLEITVSNRSGGIVSYTVDKNGSQAMDAADFSAAFNGATGKTLSYVKFSLPSSYCGKLYYGYNSYGYDSTVSSSTKYYVHESSYLSYVTFVPHDDYTGTVSVFFTAYASDGGSYSGKLVLFVVDSPAGIVSYTTKTNGTVTLSGDDFSDEFLRVSGSVLSYVTFKLPKSTVGTLYYKYDPDSAKGTAVSTTTKYFNGATPDLSDLTFVPAADYSGDAEISYTVYTAGGGAYAGKLKITVGASGAGTVSYSTGLNEAVTFRSSDFTAKFYSNTGGSTLSYVRFTLPSSTYGSLYYNYLSSANHGSAVLSGNAYRVNAYPYLSYVTFVPRTGYSGSFSISYTGFTSDGTSYAGKIHITVGSGSGSVSYETDSPEKVAFDASDFREAYEDRNGGSLSYVRFTLPASSAGTLYYNYASSSSYSSSVSSSTRYYASSYPYLSSVSFVPDPTYYGTLSIGYTAYGTDGSSHDGIVFITVNRNSGGTVEYRTRKNTSVALDADDFNTSFVDQTGSSLSYVKFTPPPSAYGTLYYNYTASGGGIRVNASTCYYRSSYPKISDVTFVPAADYVGTAAIAYACYSTGGRAYSGLLNIVVIGTQPFSDVGAGYSWAAPAISALYERGVIQGYENGLYHPDDNISRGGFLVMVARALELDQPASDNFSDVIPGSYYYDAIASAKAAGIALGSHGLFYPDGKLSRQDAAVLLARALSADGHALPAASAADLSGYSDADSVSSYAAEGVAALVNAGILQGSGGALYPKRMISRAEMAVILYRVLEWI